MRHFTIFYYCKIYNIYFMLALWRHKKQKNIEHNLEQAKQHFVKRNKFHINTLKINQ